MNDMHDMHEIDSGYPLSPEQQVALDTGRPAPQLRISLNGALDEQRLHQALLSLVARHESLRLALRPSPLYRGLRQQLMEADLDWQVLDLRTAADSLEARLAELRAQPFALDSGRLLRAVLVRLDERAWHLALSLAPSAGDRLSLEILFAELPQVYDQPYAEREEVFQYSQFIAWRAELAADPEAETGRAYWADLGLEQLPALHLGYRRQAQADSNQGCLPHALPATLSAELERLAEAQQQPLPTLLQAAWWALLARIGGQTAFAGGWQHDCRRDYEALAGGVGVFDKVLPLPLRLDPAEPFCQWLQRLALLLEAHVGAQEYWPLAEPPQQAHLSVGFALAGQPGERQAAGLSWRALQLPGADPRFELALQVQLTDSGVTLALHHDGARYALEDAQCLLEQYLCLLEQLPTRFDAPLAELALSPAAHRPRQLALCGPT
ncbi:MAG TPA: condensation domain-containing protein, partial [Pseudomonas sp.]|nr:condensation domain-containing protein [Pseudomonas sp.]